jgi:uncharacterized cupredoxin-like copper-binding protein
VPRSSPNLQVIVLRSADRERRHGSLPRGWGPLSRRDGDRYARHGPIAPAPPRSEAALRPASARRLLRELLPMTCFLTMRGIAASAMRIAIVAFVVALAGCGPRAVPGAQSTVAASNAAQTVTIVLTNFAFTPDHITLRADVPVRLHLVNQSDGGHDFSAPALFAASSFSAGSMAPVGGKIEVDSHQTADVALTPNVPGSYPVECTHFLHSLFGMTATIQVVS